MACNENLKYEMYGKLHGIDHDNCMGLVRYYLAIAVFIAHFNEIFHTGIFFPTSSYNAVGAFFALSGFLVYQSFLKSPSLKDYAMKRARRILPPYTFIVCLCAFGLVFVSDLPAKDFFTDTGWFKYLSCNLLFLNFLAPTLPGVFTENAIHAVNGSLWTMKIEILLYMSVPLFFYVSARMHRRFGYSKPFRVFLAIYLLSMIYRLLFSFMYDIYEKEIYSILSRQVFGQLMYFYTGVFIYFNYGIFKKNRISIAAICLVIAFIGSYIPYYQIILGPVIVSSLTLVASSFRGWIKVFNRNNISYDIYLFHFPVLQVMNCYALQYGTVYCFFMSLMIIVGLGCFSWFMIEKKYVSRNRKVWGMQN